MLPISHNIKLPQDKMSRSYKSSGIGFAAPNDPRLSSPRVIASQTQAKILLKPPSILLQSPPTQQSLSAQSCITSNTALPPPLSAVSLLPSISQQKFSATTAEATEGFNSSTANTSTSTITTNATQTGQQTRSIATALPSPSKTTFNSTPASYTLNQSNARSSKPDPMTTPNSVPSTSNTCEPERGESEEGGDDDDIQSIVIIKNNSFSSPFASKTATVAATPTQLLTPSTSSSLSSTSSSSSLLYKSNLSSPTKQNNINTKTVDHTYQKPQSSSQVYYITSPKKQTSNIIAEESNISDRSQNGKISQASFLKMKSRPKKNDRASVISSVDSLKMADERLIGSLSSEDEKFSTPPNQPGQNKNSPQSPNKLHQRQQQSHLRQDQTKSQQQQTDPQSLQQMQSKPQQPEQQQQTKKLQSPQQDPIQNEAIPSTSDSTLKSKPSEKSSTKPPLSQVYYTYGSKSSSSNYPETPFSWAIYLKIKPAEAAPKDAFMQATEPIENNFKVGMKLEAKDPRKGDTWCLASIVYIEGLRLKLRFDGSDSMNDFFELVDSENIRSIGSCPGSLLVPPIAFQVNLSHYLKFVEKTLARPDTVIAPPELFHAKPARPSKNFFKVGMKLEAIDRKNPQLICPATIGEVDGTDIKVIFDGWKGPFDYRCTYYSRDIFPINWCRDTGHNIMCPKGWDQLLSSQSDPTKPDNNSPSRTIYLPTPPTSRPQTPPAKAAQGVLKMKKTKSRKKQDSASSGSRQPSKSPPPSPKDREQPAGGDNDQDATLEDDNEEITNPEQVSCMRTIPIDVWRKMKQQKSSSSTKPGKPEPPPTKKAKRAVWLSESDEGSDASAKETKHVNFSEDLVSTQDNLQPENNKSNVFKSPTLRHLSESEIFKTLPGNPTDWTVDDVLNLIKADETLAKYSNIFESHEIDGKAFALLTHDVMINHMGLKIGPVLKIHDLIEQVKKLK